MKLSCAIVLQFNKAEHGGASTSAVTANSCIKPLAVCVSPLEWSRAEGNRAAMLFEMRRYRWDAGKFVIWGD